MVSANCSQPWGASCQSKGPFSIFLDEFEALLGKNKEKSAWVSGMSQESRTIPGDLGMFLTMLPNPSP